MIISGRRVSQRPSRSRFAAREAAGGDSRGRRKRDEHVLPNAHDQISKLTLQEREGAVAGRCCEEIRPQGRRRRHRGGEDHAETDHQAADGAAVASDAPGTRVAISRSLRQ